MSGAASRCIVCGDAPTPVLRKGSLVVVRSPGCGLQWRDPLPNDAELAELYGPDYLERWAVFGADDFERVRAMKRATYRALLAEIERYHSDGRLLDVGCALGFLVELAGEQGFDAHGVDVNREAVRRARERLGDRVRVGRLDAVPAGPGFDVVTFVDVLEHEPDPGALLGAVGERLAPGGVLAAVLPNAAIFTRRLLRTRWPHYTPEHLYHWSPACLARFLGDMGWEVLALRTGFRKTFTASYLAAYAAHTAPWLQPLLRPLGHLGLRVGTGEMLVIARLK